MGKKNSLENILLLAKQSGARGMLNRMLEVALIKNTVSFEEINSIGEKYIKKLTVKPK